MQNYGSCKKKKAVQVFNEAISARADSLCILFLNRYKLSDVVNGEVIWKEAFVLKIVHQANKLEVTTLLFISRDGYKLTLR